MSGDFQAVLVGNLLRLSGITPEELARMAEQVQGAGADLAQTKRQTGDMLMALNALIEVIGRMNERLVTLNVSIDRMREAREEMFNTRLN
ncbi:MAG: hypothetical protein ACREBU_00540 [Nitrososphaera sp.]